MITIFLNSLTIRLEITFVDNMNNTEQFDADHTEALMLEESFRTFDDDVTKALAPVDNPNNFFDDVKDPDENYDEDLLNKKYELELSWDDVDEIAFEALNYAGDDATGERSQA